MQVEDAGGRGAACPCLEQVNNNESAHRQRWIKSAKSNCKGCVWCPLLLMKGDH